MKRPTEGSFSEPISHELLKQLAFSEKMAELGRISAGMVHEINAPLSVIISGAQMIMREEDVSDFVREMVGRISSEAQRLSHMTRCLLSFSGRDEGGAREADINLAADFVLDFVDFEAARRKVMVLRNLDYRLPLVRVEQNILRQVLLNLVMNALQAMENQDGGKLMVETSAQGGDTVRIIVTDTGPGIYPGDREKIFEPYFTTKRPGEGTGLGLFITRNLVESMGGTIDVASTVGTGTTFTVTFDAVE